jgi:PAS domain S-box-containing protein
MVKLRKDYLTKILLPILIITLYIFTINEASLEEDYKLNLSNEEKEWLKRNKDTIFTLATEEGVSLTTFYDDNTGSKGLQYILIDLFKQDLGINIELVQQNSMSQFTKSIKDQRYDMYIGLNKNDKTSKYVNFMDSIWEVPYYCYGKKDYPIYNIYSLENHKIGFISEDNIINELHEKYPTINYEEVYYNNRTQLYKALENNEIDAIFTNSLYVGVNTEVELYFKVSGVKASLARISVNKKHSKLCSILIKELIYLRRNGCLKHIFDETESKFTSYIFKSLLTAEEQNWLTNNNKIIFGFSKETFPYNMYKRHNYTGINLHYINALSNLLGVQLEAYDNINNLNWNEIKNKCKDGHIHLISSASGDYKDIDGEILYTVPYLSYNTIVVGNERAEFINNIHDLEDKRVVIDESSPISYFLKEKCSIDNLFLVDSEDKVIDMILKNKADYTVYSDYKAVKMFNVISKKIRPKGELNIKLHHQFAVSKKHKELVSILNKGISLIDSDDYFNTYKYFQSSAYKYKEQSNQFIIRMAIIIFIVIIIVLFRLYRSLVKQREYENRIRRQEFELQRYSKIERGERAACISFFEWDMIENTIIPNDYMYELIGRSKNELSNKFMEWHKYIHPDDIDNCIKLVDKIKNGEKDVVSLEYRYKNGNTGNYMWVKSTYKVIEYNEYSQPIRAIGMNQDITQMKEMEQTIRQNEKMTTIGQLASGIAHDFNNILTGILGYSELLKTKYKNDEKHNKWTNQIIESANRASTLTRKLLDFSRKSPMVKTKINVNKSIEDAIKILHYNLNKNVIIKTDFKEEVIYIYGDDTQIETIFINLGMNANDAMPNGGELIFVTEIVKVGYNKLRKNGLSYDNNKFVRISVKDNGVGMSKEVSSKIFEPFFTTKTVGKGVGLGLSSVDGIVTVHKGFIVLNTEEGKGSNFIIFLPLEE